LLKFTYVIHLIRRVSTHLVRLSLILLRGVLNFGLDVKHTSHYDD